MTSGCVGEVCCPHSPARIVYEKVGDGGCGERISWALTQGTTPHAHGCVLPVSCHNQAAHAYHHNRRTSIPRPAVESTCFVCIFCKSKHRCFWFISNTPQGCKRPAHACLPACRRGPPAAQLAPVLHRHCTCDSPVGWRLAALVQYTPGTHAALQLSGAEAAQVGCHALQQFPHQRQRHLALGCRHPLQISTEARACMVVSVVARDGVGGWQFD